MHVTSNAQLSLAVDAARQVIAKTFKRQISSKIAGVEHSNASSASQADEKGRYVSWRSAKNSFRKKTYLLTRKNTAIVHLSAQTVNKEDILRKMWRRIPVDLARRLVAVEYSKQSISSERRAVERKNVELVLLGKSSSVLLLVIYTCLRSKI